jgi:hypothetical protein
LICDQLSSAELRRCGGRTDAVFFIPDAVGSNPGEMILDLHEAVLFPRGFTILSTSSFVRLKRADSADGKGRKSIDLG